jgi:hypothetical protein
MKKVILVYGAIAGTIVGGLMLLSMPLWEQGIVNFDNGELVGYTTMVVALSMVFFGIKSYRDNHAGGSITFWAGCKVGLLITLVAGVMYALAWEISYARMGESFTKQMSEYYLNEKMNELKAEGASEKEMQEAREEWASFEEMYKNPLIRFPVTLMEILPVGIFITLASAGILRNKAILPVPTP